MRGYYHLNLCTINLRFFINVYIFQATIYIIEKSLTGNSAGSRISSTEVAQFLNTPMQRQQLTQLGITAAISHAKPDARQLQQYIETPPPGMN